MSSLSGFAIFTRDFHRRDELLTTIVEYGVKRYTNETRRLYGVLDAHLAKSTSGYLVGDKCTIADIAHWGWVTAAGWAGVAMDEFPNLKAWDDRMLARPGVEKGRHVPSPHTIKELLKDKEASDAAAAQAREWVQSGMAADAKK
ncbi:hypothetical protein HYFRA_00012584 [Hymenoscyphus fraxineus]|uniref:GST C-terminal domain-containing protein n=1 Tax=Hymenoscyphus fraxineus TaxID=746836 RepID=A0A9N9PTK1_9HELO|nr:hypothetical protein HYFRA_00012584 [Hymenoscyphus fraxineus]